MSLLAYLIKLYRICNKRVGNSPQEYKIVADTTGSVIYLFYLPPSERQSNLSLMKRQTFILPRNNAVLSWDPGKAIPLLIFDA